MTKDLEIGKRQRGTRHTIMAEYVDEFSIPLSKSTIDGNRHAARQADHDNIIKRF